MPSRLYSIVLVVTIAQSVAINFVLEDSGLSRPAANNSSNSSERRN